MDYARIYREFIEDRRSKQRSLRTFDRHHVVPRCLGGSDDPENIVRLIPSDHLFAHLLLAKIHGGVLISAVLRMSGMRRYNGGRCIRARYNYLREQHRKQTSKCQRDRWSRGESPLQDEAVKDRTRQKNTGNQYAKALKGRIMSDDQREAIRRGLDNPESRQRMRDAAKARPPKSAKTREKLSIALKGRRPSDATIAASVAFHTGRPITDEHRENLRRSRRGKTPAKGLVHSEEFKKDKSDQMRARWAAAKALGTTPMAMGRPSVT